MSQTYYQELWKESQNWLKKNIEFEGIIKRKGPFRDVKLAKWLIGNLFINYVRIVNRLDKCYDQMIHPQKREVIGRMLDLALGRLLELKAEIVRIELDNYCFLDNVLIELKLTHDDIEIDVPKYFRADKEKIKSHRRRLINEVFAEAEREKFRVNYLKNVAEEAKEEAWEKYLAMEEQQRIEREKIEEQQRKMMGAKGREISSMEKLLQELKESKRKSIDKEGLVDAILLLQRHERARQGRVEATWAKKYKQMKEQGIYGMKVFDKAEVDAAKVIQRHWRRYQKRRKKQKNYEELLQLLGIAMPSFKDNKKLSELEKTERLRRKLQEKNMKEYEEATSIVKAKVTSLYAMPMEESIVDEIRAWFEWFFEKTNFFPDFPPEKPVIPTGEIMGVPKKLGQDFVEKAFPRSKKKNGEPIPSTSFGKALAGLSAMGGSALVSAGHWIGPQEFLICQKELEKMQKSGKTEDKKGSTKEEALARKKKLKEQEKKRALAEAAMGFQLKESSFLIPLKKADRDYRTLWLDLDESENYEQKYIYSLLKDEKCWELSMEVRETVDEFMRLELEILKDALEKDKNPKKKKKKKGKPKAKKEKKKKEKKDLTGDRTLDDLFMELFKNGIIRDYEEAHLEDYIGDKSFAAFEFRERNIDWPPSMGNVRELILQLCILPLGSIRIHQLGPLIKSICLLGPENSGKEFLARIICTETASVMFDLSPANVAGKYPGKSGLKMLQHLIEKMSRALQPSIIFVDGAEKTFYKKVPKEEKGIEPKRMAGIIKKLVKGIKPSDQVLLLGVCSQPWLAKRKNLLKTYQKLILVPQTDYGSYVRIWQTLLTPYKSVSRNFDVSCLAKASDGYSAKAIMDAVKNVFTIERISTSQYIRFRPQELLDELLKSKPLEENKKEKCLKFYAGTELPKKRAKRLEEIKREAEKPKK